MTPLFGLHAPRYYARGLPVIPLQTRDKRPIIPDWSRFHDRLPTPEEQAHWLSHYAAGNLGLVLGAQARVLVIDIDTQDPALVRLITGLLPPSPWVRVGKKGQVLAYRFNGLPTFRIKDITGKTLVECLSSRTQVVLPPSIHPDTGRAYEANADLLDVVDVLPVLNPEIEALLRGALKEQGVQLSQSGWTKVTEWVPVGARDVQMTSVAGLLAYGVLRGERTLVEAIDLLKAWWSSCTEHIAGDDVDIEKGIRNLVRFVHRDVVEKGRALPKGWDDGLSAETKEAMGLTFTEDQEEWDYERIKTYVHGQFERHIDPESPSRMMAVEYALVKIAQARHLTSLDEERLLRYIADAGGLRLTVTNLRRRLRELSAGDVQGHDHTEIARAVIKDVEQYGPLRLWSAKFWTWAGSHWVEKPRSELLKVVADNYGSMDAARKNSDHKGVVEIIANLVPQTIQTLDVKGVNFANGVLLTDLRLTGHDPGFGLTYTLPYRYLPSEAGRAVTFFDFLHRAWGTDPDYRDKVAALQEAMCATIFGLAPKFQRAVLLHGPGKTGKSTLLTIVAALVPEDARTVCPPDTWADKFAPTTMLGKVINLCGELSEKKAIDGQRFKSIVDGEEQVGQYKGGQLFKFRPACAHWFASNHLPRTDDTSSAFNRRWLILTFSTPISAGERRLDYGDQVVAEEREAIAAWAVEALPRLLERAEYTLPASHERAIEEVANINNSVRFFIRESNRVRVECSPAGPKTSARTSETRLHAAYWSFCVGVGGAKPVGPRTFRHHMRDLSVELGFRVTVEPTASGGEEVVYSGLTLADGPVGSRSTSAGPSP